MRRGEGCSAPPPSMRRLSVMSSGELDNLSSSAAASAVLAVRLMVASELTSPNAALCGWTSRLDDGRLGLSRAYWWCAPHRPTTCFSPTLNASGELKAK